METGIDFSGCVTIGKCMMGKHKRTDRGFIAESPVRICLHTTVTDWILLNGRVCEKTKLCQYNGTENIRAICTVNMFLFGDYPRTTTTL